MGLLGVIITHEGFYEAASDDTEVIVDLEEGAVKVIGEDGQEKGEWAFRLSQMERDLIEVGGITEAFRKFGRKLFEVLTRPRETASQGRFLRDREKEVCGSMGELQW